MEAVLNGLLLDRTRRLRVSRRYEEQNLVSAELVVAVHLERFKGAEEQRVRGGDSPQGEGGEGGVKRKSDTWGKRARF